MLQAIDERELHLARLHELIGHGIDGLPPNRVATVRNLLSKELMRLRMKAVNNGACLERAPSLARATSSGLKFWRMFAEVAVNLSLIHI